MPERKARFRSRVLALALALPAIVIGAPEGTAVPDTLPTEAERGDVPAPPALLTPRSGYFYQSQEIRALQDDDFANPAMLWVDQGKVLWREAGPGGAARLRALPR